MPSPKPKRHHLPKPHARWVRRGVCCEAATQQHMAPASGFFWGRSAEGAMTSEANVLSKAKSALESKLTELMGEGGRRFAAEYDRLSRLGTSSRYTSTHAMANAQKNRYRNIVPYDFNRVLMGPDGRDYINASVLRSPNDEVPSWCFIASQGPLRSTVEDFWRMVLEQGSSAVVMLTRTVERQAEKCAPYFPDLKGDECVFGRFHVLVEDLREVSVDITVRTLRVTENRTGDFAVMEHYHYHEWPDHGVPEYTKPLRDLITLLESRGAMRWPVLVHCSAGIGRTGTFCAVYVLLRRLLHLLKTKDASMEQIKKSVDIAGVVARLRKQRMGMVQTIDQYYFCYQAVMQELEAQASRWEA